MKDQPAIAHRMERIEPFHVMDLLARARELEARGRSIVHMEIGEPDFATPEPIVRAGHRALEAGKTHYTPALGLADLRQTIATHYSERFGVSVDAGRVAVTPGSSGALQLILSVLVNPGETVIMTDPGYPCNRHFVELVGGIPKGVPVDADTGYQLSAAMLEKAWSPSVRAVVLASPSNPTGTLISQQALSGIHRLVSERGASLIVDEIYQGLVYGGRAFTALSHADDVFVINSFSKYFNMTGWRLGWAVAPAAYVDALDRLAQNIFLAAPTLSQYAALEAFAPETIEILEQRRLEFQRRRDFLLPALRKLGFRLPVTPDGAFYLYANSEGVADDSRVFCERLLARAGVAVTPGIDFGRNRPEKHVRFAYTTLMDRLAEGVRRIEQFLRAA
jgi:aspartate/methionine/tyrosine aminotransferase